MSDYIKQPEGNENELKTQLDALKQELDFQKSEAKKAFEKRDAAKKELDEYQRKQLEEQEKYKELYESTLKEFEENKKTYATVQEQYENLVTSQKEELLGRLDGDAKKFAETLDIDKLREFVKINAKEVKPLDSGTKVCGNAKPKQYKSYQEWFNNY